jgi:hypothetical protein
MSKIDMDRWSKVLGIAKASSADFAQAHNQPEGTFTVLGVHHALYVLGEWGLIADHWEPSKRFYAGVQEALVDLPFVRPLPDTQPDGVVWTWVMQ